MMTALCAARNILGAKYDLWAINTEPEYHEEKREEPATEPARPAYAQPPRVERARPVVPMGREMAVPSALRASAERDPGS